MKYLSLLLLTVLLTVLLYGCFSVRVVAPHDQKIELASKADQLGFKEKQRNWYFLWGLVPINENATDKKIKENGLTKVRIETKRTFVDMLISFFLSEISIATTTTIIEGESKKSKKSTNLLDME